jgi:hypothetical protein
MEDRRGALSEESRLMLTASFRRTAILFAMIAVLVTPWVSAQTRRVRPVQIIATPPANLLDLVLGFLRPYLKEGCKVDPDGRCYASQTPDTKAGCKIDPNGGCYTGLTQPPYAGCKVDPDGRCLP